MDQIVKSGLQLIAALVAPFLLLQCGGSAKPVDLAVIAQSSSSSYVRACQRSDYPEAISTLKGDPQVRESIEEMNLEVFCTFAAWEAQVDAENLSVEARKEEAKNQFESDRADCQALSNEPAEDGGPSERETCRETADEVLYLSERSAQFEPLELSEFKDFCNSLVGLIALIEIYPDSVHPRALGELVSLEDSANCSSR